ncbi:MAG TPA: two-component regulator propeller domain-containing protein, partial [Phaeodactylibacter sp.]|nr:two-component regulator propeller domain-containing protein [Phaeodactylibacter sp.]
MRRHRFISTTPNLLFLGLLLAAQWLAFPAFAQTYSYRHYTVEDGLPTNYVYGGLQDSRGYIWFYTEKGVSRFDGYEFRNFTTEDGLPTNDVWQLAEDSQGRMWVGCFGGKFVAIDKDSVVVINQDSTAVTQTRINRANGKIWVYVQGARRYSIVDDGQTLDTIFHVESDLISSENSDLGIGTNYYIIDRDDGKLYFTHSPPKAIVVHPRKNKLDTFRIKGLTEELAQRFRNSLNVGYLCHNNQLFLAPPQDGFVYSIDIAKRALSSRNVAKILGKPPTYCQFQEQGGKLILQTDIGCILFDENFAAIDTLIVDFTEQQSVSKIFTDREGNYWIPTREQGVYLLTAQAKRTKIIKAAGTNAMPALTDLAFSPDGILYAGSQYGTIYRLEDDMIVKDIPAPSLPLNDLQRVRKLIFTESGTLWAAKQKYGLRYYPPTPKAGQSFNQVIAEAEINISSDQIKQFSSPKKRYMISNLERNIKDLAWHEPSQRLYVARSAYGYVYQATSGAKPQLKFISTQRNHAAYFTSDGTLWMGLKQGLANYREDRYKKINTRTMIDERAVFCFGEDAQGRLWLGTDGAGIFTQQEDSFIQIPGTDGLIVQDLCIKEGAVWGATNKGIWQIDVNPSGGAGIVEEVYNTSHGLPSLEIMAVEANEHYVYAATSKGLAQLQLNQPAATDEEIALIIDQVKINGEKVALDSVYQLNYKQNELEVNFTALSYRSQGNITYFYQLENA